MKFILIIFLSFHFDGGVHSQKIEFDNKELCERAKFEIVTDFKKQHVDKQTWGRRNILVTCVKQS